MYKEISIKKVREIVNRLDNAAYAKEWGDWARKWYGPKAYKVKLNVNAEYNDEGYSTRVEDATVLDKNGKTLEATPDTTIDEVKEELERIRHNNAKTVDRDKIYSKFKGQFPMLDDAAWTKMTDAESVKQEAAINDELQEDIESSIREEIWELDYPNNGDAGSNYSATHEFIIADEDFKAPKFFVLDE